MEKDYTQELYTMNKEAKRLRDILDAIYDISEHLEYGEQRTTIDEHRIEHYILDDEQVELLYGSPCIASCMWDGGIYATWAYRRYLNHLITKKETTYIQYDEEGYDNDGFTQEENEEEIAEMKKYKDELDDKLSEVESYKIEIQAKINELYKLKHDALKILIKNKQAKIVGYHGFVREIKNYSHNDRYHEYAEDADWNDNCYDEEEGDCEEYVYRSVVEYNGFRFHYQIVSDEEELKDLGMIKEKISSENNLVDGPTVDKSIQKLRDLIGLK